MYRYGRSTIRPTSKHGLSFKEITLELKRHAIPELNGTKTNVVVHDELLCGGGSIDNAEVFLVQ